MSYRDEVHGLDNDEDDMFTDGPTHSSFAFSITEGTPSPRKKLKLRDSRVIMSDDQGMSMNMMGAFLSIGALGSDGSGDEDYLSMILHTSTSVNSGVDVELAYIAWTIVLGLGGLMCSCLRMWIGRTAVLGLARPVMPISVDAFIMLAAATCSRINLHFRLLIPASVIPTVNKMSASVSLINHLGSCGKILKFKVSNVLVNSVQERV